MGEHEPVEYLPTNRHAVFLPTCRASGSEGERPFRKARSIMSGFGAHRHEMRGHLANLNREAGGVAGREEREHLKERGAREARSTSLRSNAPTTS